MSVRGGTYSSALYASFFLGWKAEERKGEKKGLIGSEKDRGSGNWGEVDRVAGGGRSLEASTTKARISMCRHFGGSSGNCCSTFLVSFYCPL